MADSADSVGKKYPCKFCGSLETSSRFCKYCSKFQRFWDEFFSNRAGIITTSIAFSSLVFVLWKDGFDRARTYRDMEQSIEELIQSSGNSFLTCETNFSLTACSSAIETLGRDIAEHKDMVGDLPLGDRTGFRLKLNNLGSRIETSRICLQTFGEDSASQCFDSRAVFELRGL